MPFVGSTATPYDHAVNFYDHEAELVAAVAEFVADGFALGARAIVVGTDPHRSLLDEALLQRDLNPMLARATGRLVSLDAEETLDTFMADRVPNPEKFRSSIGDLIDTASQDGSPVRVFGEMVALLWEQDNVAGAIELEALWNDLARERRFSLLCAYSLGVVGGASLDDLNRVCGLHSRLEPPRSYAAGGPCPPAVCAELGRSSKTFLCVSAAVPAVRRFVSEVLTEWGREELIPDAILVASELATNAVRHAHSPFRVSIDGSGPSMRIAVQDVGRTYPSKIQVTAESTWGRGVYIVDGVCEAWGTDSLAQGKMVWADLTTRN